MTSFFRVSPDGSASGARPQGQVFSFRKALFILLTLSFIQSLAAGRINASTPPWIIDQETPKGKIVVFHAGSMAIPLARAANRFQELFPETRVLLEASGSRVAARKITELNLRADLLISAEPSIIREFLFPDRASWLVTFATNEMVIAYTETSRRGAEINSENWFRILSGPDVSFGMSDPECDPAGYRTLMLWQLADLSSNQSSDQGPVFTSLKAACPAANVRPTSIQLLPLLESLWIDYCFEYRSVAEQHRLKYIRLSEKLNLSSPGLNEFYAKALVRLRGKNPGTFTDVQGRAIEYALTVPHDPPNPTGAAAFASFLLYGPGREIMAGCDQPLIPPRFETDLEGDKAPLKQGDAQ